MSQFTEAFKALDLLEEEAFNLNNTADSINAIKDFVDNAVLEGNIEVIDPDAEDEDELQDSYIGKAIIECSVCHQKIFKDKDELIIDDETGLVNVDEECPYCYSEDGYTIVGQVDPYVAPEDEEIKVEIDDEPVEVEEEVSAVKEGLDTEKQEVTTEEETKVVTEDLIREAHEKVLEEATKDSVCPDCGKDPCECEKVDEPLEEGFEHVNVETADSVLDMSQDDSGKVTVTSEPKEPVYTGEEMVGPLDMDNAADVVENSEDEVLDDIDVAAEEAVPEETVEDEVVTPTEEEVEDFSLEDEEEDKEKNESLTEGTFDGSATKILKKTEAVEAPQVVGVEDAEVIDESKYQDVDINEIDEKSFNKLAESYLKNVYENIDNYQTTACKDLTTHMMIEGVVTFNSGKTKDIAFKFNPGTIKENKVSFTGGCESLTESVNESAYSLKGKLDNGTLVFESFKYNYPINESVVRGSVKNR